MGIARALLPEFDNEMANTRKLLERVPEDRPDYRPHEKSMPLARLAAHIAEMPSWATTTLTTDSLELPADYQPAVMQSREQLLALFDANVANAREAIRRAGDEELIQGWSLRMQGKMVLQMSRASVIRNMVMNHMIHHRAQLGVYLRLNDIAIPGMYGPSVDDRQAVGATA